MENNDPLKDFKNFLILAKFEKNENQIAILKLCIATGIADYFLDIANYFRQLGNRPLLNNLPASILELKGKSIEERVSFLSGKNIEKLFNFVVKVEDKNASTEDKNITAEDFNNIIVAFTQFSWFARNLGQERFDIPKLIYFDNQNIMNLIKETGIEKRDNINDFEKNAPIAVLGSTYQNMYKRFEFAMTINTDIDQSDKSAIKRKMFFLVGDRKINTTEKQIADLLKDVIKVYNINGLEKVPSTLEEVTETDCARVIVYKINQERKKKSQPEIDVKFIDTPANLNYENPALGRPNTEATVRYLFKTVPNIKDTQIIFISDPSNIEPQRMAIERVYEDPSSFKLFKVTGSVFSESGSNVSQLLPGFAGRLFAAYPRQPTSIITQWNNTENKETGGIKINLENDARIDFRENHLTFDKNKGFVKYLKQSISNTQGASK